MFVFLIRIRIRRIHMFLGLPDPHPEPLVRGRDLRIRIRSKNVTDPQHWKMLLDQGGFLFSVVSPLDSVISLGLSVTAGSSLGKQVGEADHLSAKSVYGSETQLLERMLRE
jgi:hypothetical protein